jgi:hypothetical protein
MTRWPALALAAATLVAFFRPGGPQALAIAPETRESMRELWAASMAARSERVACLASVVDGDTLRITGIEPLAAGADSGAVSAGASLERCGPPEWQGTVHTHIPIAEGRRANGIFSGADRGVMLMWWQRWKTDGTFCLLYAEDQAHCEIDGSRVVILPSERY